MWDCLDCIYGHKLLTYVAENIYQEDIVCLREYTSNIVPQTLYQCTFVQPELCDEFKERSKDNG